MTLWPQENEKQSSSHPESGRSMTEMLGVVVLLFVITLGCIWGFVYALNYTKANAIVSGAQTRLMAVDRRNLHRDLKKTKQVIRSFSDIIYDIYPTEVEERVGHNPVLKVSGISKEVCQLLKRRTEAPMTINDEVQEAANCLDEGNIARFDLTIVGHYHDSDPVDPCAGMNCICGCSAGACIDSIRYSRCVGGECKQEDCCPDSCPADQCHSNVDCGGGESCQVGSVFYDDGADIGTCKQCHNGGIIDKPGYVVPDCKTCNNDGTLSPITDSTADAYGKCCVNGERKFDETLCPDPSIQCKIGSATYNSGATIGDCARCVNGSIEDYSFDHDCDYCDSTTDYNKTNKADNTEIAGNVCKLCDGNGNTKNKANGTAISGEVCKECQNGAVANKAAGTPISGKPCQECNGTGGERNKANGSNASNGECCVDGEMAESATYCPKSCTYKGETYASGNAIGDCGKCNNGSGEVDNTKVTDCHTCNTSTYALDPVTSSDKDSEGKCCVNGERKFDETLCPDPSTQCKIGSTTYNNGATIGDCGKCNNGSGEVDNTKVTDCHTCNTSTYALDPVTSSDKDSEGKCCVNGERKFDEALCPDLSKQCTFGGATYNDGVAIGDCGKCENETATMNGVWRDTDCYYCSSLTDYIKVAKSGYTLTDDGVCCSDDDIYTEGGQQLCCTKTCGEDEKLIKETCTCCGPATGCCPDGRELCNLVCCAKGAHCNPQTKVCCAVGEEVSNGHCCPEGASWASKDGKCCAVGQKVTNGCCGSLGLLRNPASIGSTMCCADGNTAITYGNVKVCCPSGSTVYIPSTGTCCGGTVCGDTCCLSTDYFCNTDIATGKLYCCLPEDFE